MTEVLLSACCSIAAVTVRALPIIATVVLMLVSVADGGFCSDIKSNCESCVQEGEWCVGGTRPCEWCEQPKHSWEPKCRKSCSLMGCDSASSSVCPTTRQPSTKQPSTKQPSTKQPSTKQPSTKQPSTKQPSTKQPSTKQPTTAQPSTKQPTTAQPSTKQPTTAQPTTRHPRTAQPPTTAAPSLPPGETAIPATEEPTTDVPTGEVPSTEVPTTEQPTTEVPTSEVPTTEVPTSEVPSTEVPSTTVPTTQQPEIRTHTSSCSPNISVSRTVENTTATAEVTETIPSRCRFQLVNDTVLTARENNVTEPAMPTTVLMTLLDTEFITPEFPAVSQCINLEPLAVVGAENDVSDSFGSDDYIPRYGDDILLLLWFNTTIEGVATPDDSRSQAVMKISLGSTPLLAPGGPDFSIRLTVAAGCVRYALKECSAVLRFVAPPRLPLPGIVTPAFESGQTVAGAFTASVPGVAASLAQVNRVSLSAVLAECLFVNEPMDFYNSPLGLVVGTSNVSYSIGTILGNILLVALFGVAQLAVGALVVARSSIKPVPPMAARSLARFPSALLLPLLFVQQPTATAAVLCLVYGGEPIDYIFGVVGIAFVLGTVFFTSVALCIQTKPADMCVYHPKLNVGAKHVVVRFFYGTGTWKDRNHESCFKQRYSLFFTDFREECPWFMVIEMCMNVVCGVIQGLVHPSQCRNLLAVSFCAFLLFTLLTVGYRPYSSPWGALSSVALCMLQTVAAGSVWVAVYYEFREAMEAASSISVLCFYILVMQSLVGLLPKAKALSQIKVVMSELWNPDDYFRQQHMRRSKLREDHDDRGSLGLDSPLMMIEMSQERVLELPKAEAPSNAIGGGEQASGRTGPRHDRGDGLVRERDPTAPAAEQNQRQNKELPRQGDSLEDLMKALEEVAGRGEEPNEGQPLGGGGFQSRTTAMLQPQAVQDDSIICNIRLLPSAADDAGAATLPLASETKGSTGVEVAGDGEAIDDDL